MPDTVDPKFPMRSQLAEGALLERPVIERPDLGAMSTDFIEALAADMPASRGGPDTSGLPDMAPADQYPEQEATADPGDQTPAPPTRDAAQRGGDQGYVRLRVHVEDGAAEVTSVSRVDGPLVTADAAGGGYVWEVVVDGERVAADAIGDVSTWRSFPDPQATPQDARKGHHLTPLAAFDFTARVPASDLTTEALGRAEVGVFRVKDAGRPLPFLASRRPLAQEYPRELRPVARVAALDENHLGTEVAGRLRGLLSE